MTAGELVPVRPHVVVIGGGIAGLAAAWALTQAATQARDPVARRPRPRVTVLEADDRFGGKLRTDEFVGHPVDAAADTFLTRVPWARQLCAELGLTEQLVSPARSSAKIWSRDALHDFPEATVLGVPSSLTSLARSEVVSPRGIARAYVDLLGPRSLNPKDDDPAIGLLARRRLGDEIVDRVLDPLIGGINAGSVDHLGTLSAAPQIADLTTKGHSLIRAAKEQLARRDPDDAAQPVFAAPKGGMQVLVDALCAQLRAREVDLRTGADVREVRQRGEGRWEVQIEGATLLADAIILATPAFVTARLLADVAPAAAAELRSIEYASVTLVRMAYATEDVSHPLDATGFVVPAIDGHLMTACSWASSKWAALRNEDHAIFRASAGRRGDDRAMELSDEEVVAALHLEVNEAIHVERRPRHADVVRWKEAFPQYEPGHAARVVRVQQHLARVHGIAVAGAAYLGIGVPACIRSGNEAATKVLLRLAARMGVEEAQRERRTSAEE